MATRTISNAGGNWDATTTWVGGVAPTSADDVVATATSGNVTTNVGTAACRSLDLTNYVGTLTINNTFQIGTSSVQASGIVLKLSAGMTLSHASGTVNFISSSATVQTIDMAGKSFAGSVVFTAGSGSPSWKLLSDYANTGITQLTRGTVDANGFNVRTGSFNTSGSSTKVLNMGSGTWTLTGTGTVWSTSASTSSYTQNAQTSTLVIADTSSALKTILMAVGQTLNTVLATSGGTGNIQLNGGTYTTFTINTGSKTFLLGATAVTIGTLNVTSTTGNIITLSLLVDISVGTWNVSGSSGALTVIGSSPGTTQRTITFTGGATRIISPFMNISRSTASNATGNVHAPLSTDGGNNVSWIFAAPTNDATADISGAGSLTATGETFEAVTYADGAADLVGAGDATATGLVEVLGEAALSGAGATDVSGSASADGAATLTGTGSLEGTGVAEGVTVISGTGSLTATGDASASGTGALTGRGALTAVGNTIRSGAASLRGTGTLKAKARTRTQPLAYADGVAHLSGIGIIEGGTGRIEVRAQVVLAGVGSLTATGDRSAPKVAFLSGSGSLRVLGSASAVGSASLVGVGTIPPVRYEAIAEGIAALLGEGQIAGIGINVYHGAVQGVHVIAHPGYRDRVGGRRAGSNSGRVRIPS